MSLSSRIVMVSQTHHLPPGSIGALVHWITDGDELHGTRLMRAWVAAGQPVELLPPPVTPQIALKHALDKLYGDRAHLVKPANTAGAAGYAVLARDVNSKGDPKFDTAWVVACVGALDTAALVFKDADEDTIDFVTAVWEAQRSQLTTAELSPWLSRYVAQLGGTAMKPNGGYYFLPAAGVGTWETIKAVIESISKIHLHVIPAVDCAGVTAAVLDGLVAEVAQQAAAMTKEIDTWTAGAAGQIGGKKAREATRKARLATALAVESKIDAYAAIFGERGTLDVLRQQYRNLQTVLGAACLDE